MKLVALSDTHGDHRRVDVPDGDVLVFAGDMTSSGDMDVMRDFADWLSELPYQHKIVIAGNHDLHMQPVAFREQSIELLREARARYLEDDFVDIDGYRFYGSPWTPTFERWAFRAEGNEAEKKWGQVPNDVDVLVTHGPPRGTGDYLDGYGHIGCPHLEDCVERVTPQYHVYGHVHEHHGRQERGSYNVSIVDESYTPVARPVTLKLGEG